MLTDDHNDHVEQVEPMCDRPNLQQLAAEAVARWRAEHVTDHPRLQPAWPITATGQPPLPVDAILECTRGHHCDHLPKQQRSRV